MKRRDFFKLLGIQILAASCSSTLSKNNNSEIFISRYKKKSHSDGVALINLEQNYSSHFISTNHEAHSILETSENLIFIPKTASTIVVFEKKSKNVREIEAPRNYVFYGHGIVINKGLYLSLAPEFYSKNTSYNAEGYIVEINLNGLPIPKVYPSGGKDPHQLLFSKKENILYICNGGGRSNLAKFDLVQKKVKKKYYLPDEFKNLSIRHLESANNKIYIATMCRFLNTIPTYLFTFDNEKIERIPFPHEIEKKLRIQILSILKKGNHLYFTCPATSTVFVYSILNNKIENTFDLLKATSLTYSQKLNGIIVGSSDTKTPLHIIQNTKNGFSLRALGFGKDIIGEHSHTCNIVDTHKRII